MWRYLLNVAALLFVMLAPSVSVAQGVELPRAEIIHEEGGAQFISGRAEYTFPYFRLFLPEPFVILYDIAGLVERDVNFVPSPKSQVLGVITSDPFVSPFTYELSLPALPRGELRDVDNDGETDTGVMIFMTAITSNMWADPFLEQRDNFVAGILSSARISTDVDTFLNLQGGRVIVYAGDDQQGFPSGYGEDGVLFTADDPAVKLPAGYTMVDFSSEPFVFDRAVSVAVDLLEQEDAALDDFSQLGMVEAFDAMIALLKQKYAFTEYKQIDWDALADAFRPEIERADSANDTLGYQRALRDLALRVPDGHVTGPGLFGDFQREAGGGLGVVLRQYDDGRVFITRVLRGLPADTAGLRAGDELLAVNRVPVEQALEQTRLWSSYSTDHARQLARVRYLLRFQAAQQVELTVRSAGESERNVMMQTVAEFNSLNASEFSATRTGSELPIEFEILDGGYGYLTLYSFSDDLPLMIRLWERAIQQTIESNLRGLIIDIRDNGGGSGYLGDQLPAYFFREPLVIGNTARYSERRGEFVINPATEDRFVLPKNGLYYSGPVAVLISPSCASACEAFAYAMTINGRAAIVGHYPTAGLGGSVVPIALPAGARFNYTNSRSLGIDSEINIEGKGIAPTIRVPVNEETVFERSDAILDAAVEYLEQTQNTRFTIQRNGILRYDEPVQFSVAAGERVQYFIRATEGQVINIITTGLDAVEGRTVTRIYLPGQREAALESYLFRQGDTRSGFANLEIPISVELIIEVGTLNDAFDGTIELVVEDISPTDE